jgi:tetratricopeptide (TPR) repeat protein
LNSIASKINLIYEYNNTSPLFLRVADIEIENNNPQRAIGILYRGLSIYPDHPLAFILLGKANLAIGDYDNARKYFLKGSELIGSTKTYQHYKNHLETARRKTSLPEVKKERAFTETEPEHKETVEIKKDPLAAAKAIEDRLEQLAETLSSVRIKRENESDSSYSETIFKITERSRIVTETLAKIYLSQGQRGEAIKMYEKLIKRNPEKEDYYQGKIQEIRSQPES